MNLPDHLSQPVEAKSVLLQGTPAIEDLQKQFLVLLGILLVLSAAVFLFLWKQVSMVQKQSDELGSYIGGRQSQVLPHMSEFLKQMWTVSKTNEEVRALMNRYPFQPPQAPTAPVRIPTNFLTATNK